MCGRFALSAETDELIREYVAQGGRPQDWRPSYSIAPTDRAPIVRRHDEARELVLAGWDIPMPAAAHGRPGINARIEKLGGGWWAPSFRERRALVPMTGYYEWTGTKSPKTAHFIHGDGLLTAAGLWRDVDGAPRFAVITREARDASGEVHDRMPAFLPAEAWDDWLTGPGDAGLQQMLTDVSDTVAGTLRTHIVDSKVNSVQRVDPSDPSLIEPT
jgi:putative SOS response-associated peptidase YedK